MQPLFICWLLQFKEGDISGIYRNITRLKIQSPCRNKHALFVNYDIMRFYKRLRQLIYLNTFIFKVY